MDKKVIYIIEKDGTERITHIPPVELEMGQRCVVFYEFYTKKRVIETSFPEVPTSGSSNHSSFEWKLCTIDIDIAYLSDEHGNDIYCRVSFWSYQIDNVHRAVAQFEKNFASAPRVTQI